MNDNEYLFNVRYLIQTYEEVPVIVKAKNYSKAIEIMNYWKNNRSLQEEQVKLGDKAQVIIKEDLQEINYDDMIYYCDYSSEKLIPKRPSIIIESKMNI